MPDDENAPSGAHVNDERAPNDEDQYMADLAKLDGLEPVALEDATLEDGWDQGHGPAPEIEDFDRREDYPAAEGKPAVFDENEETPDA